MSRNRIAIFQISRWCNIKNTGMQGGFFDSVAAPQLEVRNL
jgi:hypothetical protein